MSATFVAATSRRAADAATCSSSNQLDGLGRAIAFAHERGGDLDPAASSILILQRVLNDGDIELVHEAVTRAAAATTEPPVLEEGVDVCDELQAQTFHKSFSPQHTLIYLHRGGLLQQQYPELVAKLRCAMLSQPTVWYGARARHAFLDFLDFRCIEKHT